MKRFCIKVTKGGSDYAYLRHDNTFASEPRFALVCPFRNALTATARDVSDLTAFKGLKLEVVEVEL